MLTRIDLAEKFIRVSFTAKRRRWRCAYRVARMRWLWMCRMQLAVDEQRERVIAEYERSRHA